MNQYNGIKVGDEVIYNGEIYERGYFVVKSNYEMIKIYNKYKVMSILDRNNEIYYLIDIGSSNWWFPNECFYKNSYKDYISLKYGLR